MAEVGGRPWAQRPDVALVDVQPPDVAAGLAALADLVRAAVPAVAMSANGTLRDWALAAGARAFVEKDGGDEALIEAVLSVARS